MKIKLGDHEYEVRIPAKAWPHLQVLAQSLSGMEADEARIDAAEKKVLEYCVTPEPCEDHRDAILMQVITYYASLVKEVAGIFRQ